MSGEPRTLTLTLEEAMRAVWGRLDELREKHGDLADVQMEITETGWWVFLNNDGKSKNQIKEFTRWEDAASFALGVSVVARDEAAELREENHTLRTEADGWLKRVELLEAAIREWVEATSDAEMFELDQSNAYGTDHADAEDRVEAAAQALRRLVGGENEKS